MEERALSTVYRRPPRLHPGDVVAVVAPAGYPETEALERGIALVGERYEVRTYRDHAASPFGAYSAPDDARGDELRRALDDPDVGAILAARGGYGTTRLLGPELAASLAKRPRIVVGFSDVTALLAASLRCAGSRTIHGPMVCQMGRRGKAWPPFARLVQMLESPEPREPVTGLSCCVRGRATGPLVGGNLTLLSHLVGTPYLPRLDGAVLFFEDVGERPYRLDRCLIHLLQAGALDGVAGLVVGALIDCEHKGGEHTTQRVIETFCSDLGLPSVTGLPAGHGPDNEPLPLGAPVDLDATNGTLTFLEGVVGEQ